MDEIFKLGVQIFTNTRATVWVHSLEREVFSHRADPRHSPGPTVVAHASGLGALGSFRRASDTREWGRWADDSERRPMEWDWAFHSEGWWETLHDAREITMALFHPWSIPIWSCNYGTTLMYENTTKYEVSILYICLADGRPAHGDVLLAWTGE